MCTWSAVVDVAKYMQLVDRQALDDIGYGYDEIVCTTSSDNSVDDDVNVIGFVGIVGTLVQKFLDDVLEILWQCLAHLRVGILARNKAAYRHQLMNGDVVPVVYV